ncbi:hypothetical protein C8J57DRAFT_1254094 [Mycena rebaudengoi]|nr:hypothetical protein C8J57DRAFT_1254094 [Mycena rebaudengoi]
MPDSGLPPKLIRRSIKTSLLHDEGRFFSQNNKGAAISHLFAHNLSAILHIPAFLAIQVSVLLTYHRTSPQPTITWRGNRVHAANENDKLKAAMQPHFLKYHQTHRNQATLTPPPPAPVVSPPPSPSPRLPLPPPLYKLSSGCRKECGVEPNDVDMIQCDLCRMWSHRGCTDLESLEGTNIAWNCPPCKYYQPDGSDHVWTDDLPRHKKRDPGGCCRQDRWDQDGITKFLKQTVAALGSTKRWFYFVNQ